MLILGSIMAVVGLSLLWFSPYTGVLTILIGLGIAWSSEDQKIKRKNEKKIYEEENEREFNRLKFDDPVSPRLLELSTLLYGTIKPHEAWLSAQLDDFEEQYSTNSFEAIEKTQDISNEKFRNLFATEASYISICGFLKREISSEILEDIEAFINETESQKTDKVNEPNQIANLNEILADYDLEEWAKKVIALQIRAGNDRNTIIKNVILEAKKELNKSISVSCLHDEWIVNGRIKFMI
jgi:hypothetical protein